VRLDTASDPFECLERDDVPPRQRQAIELELAAVAQTGPQAAGESSQQYALRVEAKIRQLIEQG
jgi:hypothetical protein